MFFVHDQIMDKQRKIVWLMTRQHFKSHSDLVCARSHKPDQSCLYATSVDDFVLLCNFSYSFLTLISVFVQHCYDTEDRIKYMAVYWIL
jgi:hypothetical protein